MGLNLYGLVPVNCYHEVQVQSPNGVVRQTNSTENPGNHNLMIE